MVTRYKPNHCLLGRTNAHLWAFLSYCRPVKAADQFRTNKIRLAVTKDYYIILKQVDGTKLYVLRQTFHQSFARDRLGKNLNHPCPAIGPIIAVLKSCAAGLDCGLAA